MQCCKAYGAAGFCPGSAPGLMVALERHRHGGCSHHRVRSGGRCRRHREGGLRSNWQISERWSSCQEEDRPLRVLLVQQERVRIRSEITHRVLGEVVLPPARRVRLPLPAVGLHARRASGCRLARKGALLEPLQLDPDCELLRVDRSRDLLRSLRDGFGLPSVPEAL